MRSVGKVRLPCASAPLGVLLTQDRRRRRLPLSRRPQGPPSSACTRHLDIPRRSRRHPAPLPAAASAAFRRRRRRRRPRGGAARTGRRTGADARGAQRAVGGRAAGPVWQAPGLQGGRQRRRGRVQARGVEGPELARGRSTVSAGLAARGPARLAARLPALASRVAGVAGDMHCTSSLPCLLGVGPGLTCSSCRCDRPSIIASRRASLCSATPVPTSLETLPTLSSAGTSALVRTVKG